MLLCIASFVFVHAAALYECGNLIPTVSLMNPIIANVYDILGPIIHLAQGAVQVFLLVSAWRSSHFPVLRRVV